MEIGFREAEIMIFNLKNKRGGEDALLHLIIGFVLFTLVGFLLISAVISVGEKYGKDTTEVTAGALDISGFNDTLNPIRDTAIASSAVFQETSIWTPLAIAEVVVSGIFNVGKTLVMMITTPYTLLSNIMTDVLKVPVIFAYIIDAILIIVTIFALWRLVKIGA